jgi:hypothetical protein
MSSRGNVRNLTIGGGHSLINGGAVE